jgi:hypothetical protein
MSKTPVRVSLVIPAILALILPARGGTDPPDNTLGWPLLVETPAADGEDEPKDGRRPRYFSFGLNSYAYWPRHEEQTLAERVERFLHRIELDPQTETVSPSGGVQWDLAKVWCSADKEWIFWRGTNQGKAVIHAASTQSLSNSIELPSYPDDAALDAENLDPGVVIINNRLYFLGGMEIPEPLRTTFDPALGLIAEQPHWREIAWPQHINLVEEMRERILNNIDQPPPNDDSRKTIALVRELLAKKPMRISGDDIEGDWRIRSLQGSALGHFTYPFLKARIENLDGIFFFEKTTGSQRRSGALHRHLPDTMIFLGGRTVNDDPQVGYSGAYPDNTPVDSDSIGLLHQLAPDHLIMLLDVDYNGSYEIYDMRK